MNDITITRSFRELWSKVRELESRLWDLELKHESLARNMNARDY